MQSDPIKNELATLFADAVGQPMSQLTSDDWRRIEAAVDRIDEIILAEREARSRKRREYLLSLIK